MNSIERKTLASLINNMIESYLEGSTISSIRYDVLVQKWVVSYFPRHLEDDRFDSIEALLEFLESDQHGE